MSSIISLFLLPAILFLFLIYSQKKADIEIAGLFAAVFAWGNRTTIIRKAKELMHLMDNAPHDFCLHHSAKELKALMHFKHRTFNATDLFYFIDFLKLHYQQHSSLQSAFTKWMGPVDENVENALIGFHHYFFSLPEISSRTKKHIKPFACRSPFRSCNMFLCS